MRRPSETSPGEARELTDQEAPDFLDAHAVAVLAFVDAADPLASRVRERLALVAAALPDPRLGIGILDVARERLVAQALGIQRVPELLVFKGGEAVDRILGAPPVEVLEETLRSRLRTV